MRNLAKKILGIFHLEQRVNVVEKRVDGIELLIANQPTKDDYERYAEAMGGYFAEIKSELVLNRQVFETFLAHQKQDAMRRDFAESGFDAALEKVGGTTVDDDPLGR